MKKSIINIFVILAAIVMSMSMFAGITFAEETTEEETLPNYAEGMEFTGDGIIDVLEIPKEYKKDAEHQGRVEKIEYKNEYGNKYMYVYLPYGYDESDESYNVFFLMHGGNGKPEVNLQEGHSSAMQKLLDNAFQDGELKPFILVAPSWNPATDDEGNQVQAQKGHGGELTEAFVDEFRNIIVPLIDSTYRTNATREGRGFGGFSMGGVTTWYIFLNALDLVKNFIPTCGDCWALGENGGGNDAAATAQAIADAAIAQGYTADDFLIYQFTGTADISMPNVGPQILAMQENEFFKFGETTYFGYVVDGEHIEPTARRYYYTGLHYIW